MNAIIDAFAAHERMKKQALNSDRERAELKEILLGAAQLLRRFGRAARVVWCLV